MELLDMKCAEYGTIIANIPKNEETLIRKSLGVLQEDGVYAFFLYLSAQKKDYADATKKKAFELLKSVDVLMDVFGSETDILKALREQFKDKLDELLLAKELLERTLVYARYHAKALGGD